VELFMKNFVQKKMTVLSSLVVICSMGFVSIANACDIHGTTGFLPENKFNFPVGLKASGTMTQTQITKVMDRMEKLFAPEVAKHNAKFVIDRRWNDGKVNAYAEQQTPGVFAIHMFGGLARSPGMTEDGMALVACHELGHHLGGAPRKTDDEGNLYWATNEGQADYWGTMKCIRTYFEQDRNVDIVKNMTVSPIAQANCHAQYANAEDEANCVRRTVAGLVLGKVLSSLMKDGDVDYSKTDTTVVTKTDDEHPASQCRVDTYMAGSLCDHGLKEEVSMDDANTGVCSVANGDKVGNRPTCWYKNP
jgi:hypothetical protein